LGKGHPDGAGAAASGQLEKWQQNMRKSGVKQRKSAATGRQTEIIGQLSHKHPEFHTNHREIAPISTGIA